MKAPRIGRIAIGVVAGLLLLVTFGRLGDRLILWPTTYAIPTGAAQRREIVWPTGRCEAWVTKSRAPAKRYVLRFYGNADRAEAWIDEGRDWPDDVESWGVNYPGYGTSGGKASLQAVAECALAAYDAIARAAPNAPVFVIGTSLGTTAALHVAAERKVTGVVLSNPPPLREIVLGRFGWWNAWVLAYIVTLQLPAELDSVANARRVHAPAIFVLAQKDEVVPHPYHLRVVAAYAGEHEVILRPNAQHNDPLEGAERRTYREAVARLFARTGD